MAGGEGVAGIAQATAEIYDVATKKFTLTTYARRNRHDRRNARSIPPPQLEGRLVLIAGGLDSSNNALASAEVSRSFDQFVHGGRLDE